MSPPSTREGTPRADVAGRAAALDLFRHIQIRVCPPRRVEDDHKPRGRDPGVVREQVGQQRGLLGVRSRDDREPGLGRVRSCNTGRVPRRDVGRRPAGLRF